MKQSRLYLALCVPGLLIPWFFLLSFLTDPDPSVMVFFVSIFTNHVSSAVAGDLIVSAAVFLIFMFLEGRRLQMDRLWLYIPATLLGGLSFGAPLFLYFRAKKLEQRSCS